ncbi:hypothetical protein IQ265_06220 [Nodosilinea sp. LEGE 06152]|uniref:hypothetical protein n=1 Tax=Nodosilinea sp. LEGE 06152 TaxID=2777966 RepID=UPI001880D8D1|nr:hypothetical protein [Nodosilinea sp. LEGE 06152]MBE9156424.1 hypothetical protein [Nodosilinea sp. LEGE 06152]
MISSTLALRLKQLEGNISQVLQLLNEYEKELLDEDDPGRKSKYRRRIESLKQQKEKYEEEFSDLQVQLESEYPDRAQSLSSQLQIIDDKIDLLLESQEHLFQALMVHFSPKEQGFLSPLAQKLDQIELIKAKAFIEAIDEDLIPEKNVCLMLEEARQMIKASQEKELDLPEENVIIAEIINSPEIDVKHALKVSIPIIPFILAYEGELGLGTGVNLKEAWKGLKSKFTRDN